MNEELSANNNEDQPDQSVPELEDFDEDDIDDLFDRILGG